MSGSPALDRLGSRTKAVARRARTAVGAVRARTRPDVTAVVDVGGAAPLLDACVDSVRAAAESVEVLAVLQDGDAEAAAAFRVAAAGRAVRRLVVPRGASTDVRADAAVATARGRYLAFVHPESTVAAGGLTAAVRSLDRSGSPFAVGARVDGAHAPRRSWWHRSGVQGRGRPRAALTASDALDLLTDLSAGDKLFRASWVRENRQGRLLAGAADAVMAAYLTAPGFDAVPELLVTDRSAEVPLPVERQARFDAGATAARSDSWLAAAAHLAREVPAAYDRWRALVLDEVLPPWYADAVAGGQATTRGLRPLPAGLLGHPPASLQDSVRVGPRLAADVAVHGEWEDLAVLLDHLEAHPAGLPYLGDLADLPEGLRYRPGDAARRLGPADEVLRSRVRRRTGERGIGLDCFVTYRTPTTVPRVQLGRPDGSWVEADVHPSPDPSVNGWAERAFEDRADAAFTVTAPVGDVPLPGERLRLTVSVAGHRATHDEPAVTSRDRPAELCLDEVALDGEILRLAGRVDGRAPVAARLEGPRGTTAWSETTVRDRRFSAAVPVRTGLFGRSVGLPHGRYRIAVRGDAGSPLEVAWRGGLAEAPPELVSARFALRLATSPGGEPELRVARPLSPADGSAFRQQRWREGYAAAPGGTSRRTVLLETFRGRATGDNPGAVGRALRGLDPDLDLVHVVDDPSVAVPAGTRAVCRDTAAWYQVLAAARAYVSNAVAPAYFAKKPGQVHVQTWHGTPLKRIGADRGPGDFAVWRHRRVVAAQARGWDLLVSPSPYVSAILPSAFGVSAPVLETGYPRNDLLLSAEAAAVRHRVRTVLGAADDDVVVLYAPTWREYLGVREAKPLYLDPHALVRALPNSLVLVRGHYNATTRPDLFAGASRVRDVTRYPDIADLYLAADALVTDYSSVMFDFMLTDKPVVLLVPDLEQYRDVERGFYLDLEERSPGPLVRTTDEVADVLSAADRHAGHRAWFRAEFCPHDDGQASVRVAGQVLRLMAGAS